MSNRALAAALALIAVAGAALALVVGRTTPGFDRAVDEHLNNAVAGHPVEIDLWRAISDAGGPTTWRALAVVVVVILLLRGLPRDAVVVTVALAGAAAISEGAKVIVHRARPVVEHPLAHAAGKSFPSGHSLTSFVALGLLLIMLWPRLAPGPRAGLAAACALVVAAVGVSRLMLGVHYPTDVLGGWLFGLGWLFVVTLLARRLPRRVDAPASASPG